MSRHGLSTVLLALGVILLAGCVSLVGYAKWAEWQHELTQPASPSELLAERLDLPPGAETRIQTDMALPPPVSGSRTADPAAGPPPGTAGRAAEPTDSELDEPDGLMAEDLAEEDDEVASVPEASRYGRPAWLSIPRIRVDAGVTPVKLVGGAYQVPPWNVGYHADSADPGDAGNTVFNGHLTTINAGRVFARLRELQPGDAVYVYTATHRLDWVVTEARTVPNTVDSFIDPTVDTRITLYTCAGRWDPGSQDYTHRQVVVAKLVAATPRS
jgi:LPXTG-site transpeptidase (sortase) family protein